jgi:selenocysteine lyase/cysteine desulfurase
MGYVNCDSQYKFHGPHMGALYGKYDLLDRLRAYKVRPARDDPPGKYETVIAIITVCLGWHAA